MKRVYFIRPIGMTGPIKVGCSQSPENRRSSLETWSPFPLEIIAEITGGFDLERRFHAHFIDTHLRREWFDWSEKMAETVAAINSGSFDISTLPEGCGVVIYLNGKKRPKTPDQRRQQSYSLRMTHMVHRTGYSARMRGCDAIKNGDALAISYMDAFLSAPHEHGVPIGAPWAEKARAKHALSPLSPRARHSAELECQ